MCIVSNNNFPNCNLQEKIVTREQWNKHQIGEQRNQPGEKEVEANNVRVVVEEEEPVQIKCQKDFLENIAQGRKVIFYQWRSC